MGFTLIGYQHKKNSAFKMIAICILFFVLYPSLAQPLERPMIWVKASDKAAILRNIETNPEIKICFEAFQKRVHTDLSNYLKNPKEYLSALPMDWDKQTEGKIPPITTINSFSGKESKTKELLLHYAQTAIDCGVLYFLTNDSQYAKYATDVFYTFTQAVLNTNPSNEISNGGWIYPGDHLREARELGAQFPIIYDFIQPYLLQNNMVFDVAQNKKVPFPFEDTQMVFKTYILLALEHGNINTNWSVLEAPSLVGNILALDDPEARKKYLNLYLNENTPQQDAFKKVSAFYKENNGNWPESTNYSGGVNFFNTYLMTLLTKYDSTLHLGINNIHILKALPESYYWTYPNKTETLLFGDGHRGYGPNYLGYEMGYYLGTLEKSDEITSLFGPLINSAVSSKSYDRFKLNTRFYGATIYTEPTKLLWYVPLIKGSIKEYPLPMTDEIPFAGILLQRNLSVTNKSADALMGFVGGASYVHGHATGMSMELFGQGYVLGSKGGRAEYKSEIHQNYYRLFASNNTVVVNGASEADGGWANLEINKVQKVAMEPNPKAEGVSANNSFTRSNFTDDIGDLSEAFQERTLGIVRTSPTTGYYIDVFKSKSTLPNQFHDYIYHNIGENVELKTGKIALNLHSEPERYTAFSSKEWFDNKKARHPGWHYFEDVKTSGTYSNDLQVLFTAKNLGEKPISMKLFVPGDSNREYTSVFAPPSTEGPKEYVTKKTPTLVITKKGEAWQHPFAVVYESFSGKAGSIKSVERMVQKDVFKGFEIHSTIQKHKLIQYVFVLEEENSTFEDANLKIQFKGSYAVATFNDKNEIQYVYIGQGQSFSYGNIKIESSDGKAMAAYVDFRNEQIIAKTNQKLKITLSSGVIKEINPTPFN